MPRTLVNVKKGLPGRTRVGKEEGQGSPLVPTVPHPAKRGMLGLKGSTYEEKCAKLGLKTLEERRGGQDMALVHKFLTEGTVPVLTYSSSQLPRAGQEQDKQQENMAY
jgi:hypothetical protein